MIPYTHFKYVCAKISAKIAFFFENPKKLKEKILKEIIFQDYTTPLISTFIGEMSACGNFSHPM